MLAQEEADFATQTRRRVLVAEDSSVTQDLLKLVLTRRGYEVEIAKDGRQALDALTSASFDVALLDFHLPELDGLELLARYFEQPPEGPRPWFVALTSDVEGLLESPENCEHFDRVLTKPVDINAVCAVIEELGEASAPASSDPGRRPPPKTPHIARHRALIEDLDYRFLHWPGDSDPRRLAAHALAGSTGYDAVLIDAPARPRDLAPLWHAPGLHLLPVIDLTGSLGARADLDGSGLAGSSVDTVRELIEGFHDRRALLHRDLVRSEDPSDRLLGRIHASGATLVPRLDGAEPALVTYNTILEPGIVRREAGKLSEAGFLEAAFFDRLHECASCGSARFNVREECPKCGSAHLVEESYVHHFRCAYQGPESAFRQGADLICPKCRRELRHFGHDYDRPGSMVQCASCGDATSEPAVGFICVDCGAHRDGDSVRTRDVFAYTLTDQARAYLEGGQPYLGLAQRSLRFADLPFNLVIALNAAARRYNEDGTPFTLLNIVYQNEREVVREHGPRQFDQARSLLLESLKQRLGREPVLARSQISDFVLLPGMDPGTVEGEVESLARHASQSLRLDLGVSMTAFGPEDFA